MTRSVDRPIGRTVLALALLLLGVVAATRLPLRYLPETSFPELTLSLTLRESLDPDEVGQEWARPLESAVRSLGEVRGMSGWITGRGLRLKVRFAAGVDPLRKAARLESELVPLRRRLAGEAAERRPGADRRGSLEVSPASQADGSPLAVLWVPRSNPAAVAALLEKLRSVPGVRGVTSAGRRRQELRIRLHPESIGMGKTAAVSDAVIRAVTSLLRRPQLGAVVTGGQRRVLSVSSMPSSAGRVWDWQPWMRRLESLPVPLPGEVGEDGARRSVVSLGSLASLTVALGDGDWAARRMGEPALLVWVYRDPGVSPPAAESALQDTLAAVRASGGLPVEVGWSEAEPLRRLLRRLALGGLLALLLAGLAGWMVGGARGGLLLLMTLPLATAATANALWSAGMGLDLLTLTAAMLGSAAVLPLGARRLMGGSVPWLSVLPAAITLPVVVALAGGDLGPMLAAPARAFALSLAAMLPVLWWLPRCPAVAAGRPSPGSPVSRAGLAAQHLRASLRGGLRSILRDPATVLLVTVTVGASLLTVFGPVLEPQAGSLRSRPGDLTAELQLPEGATRGETAARLERAEAVLQEMPEVAGFWSFYLPGRAVLEIDLHPRHRRPERQRLFRTKLTYRLSGAGATALVAGAADTEGGELRFTDDLEERAETDKEATFYRTVLRATDAELLRRTYQRLRDRILAAGLSERHIHARWGGTAVRQDLRPRSTVSPSRAAHLARLLAERTQPPPRWPLPGEENRFLVLERPGFPKDPETVPQLTELLHRPLAPDIVPAALVDRREQRLLSGLPREAGRFVLPITVRLPYVGDQRRKDSREALHRALGGLPLPPGADLERPSLSPFQWRRERLRMLALAAALPLLLWAVGTFRLDSVAAGLASLVPPALGVAGAATVLWLGPGRVEELTLLALAAVVCGVQAVVLEVAAVAQNPSSVPPDSKRRSWGIPGGGRDELAPPPDPAHPTSPLKHDRAVGGDPPRAAANSLEAGRPETDGRDTETTGRAVRVRSADPQESYRVSTPQGPDFEDRLRAPTSPAEISNPSNTTPGHSIGAHLYRLWSTPLPAVALTVPAVAVLLAGVTPWTEAGREPWEAPLRAAAVTAVVALLAAVTALPALLSAGLTLRHRDPEAERRRRFPLSWREPGVTSTPPTLAVRRVTREYGSGASRVRALSAVSFHLEPGITGLLGPNGAGKTTLIRLLTGLLEPTRGQVLYRGARVLPGNRRHYRRAIGFLPQEFNAYEHLTVAGFLEYWALEMGLNHPTARRREIGELLESVDLADHAGRKVRDLSGGMRRRAGIARALLGAPPILIVDEPTTGLDIESRDAFRRTLLAAAGERIVLFSTHIAGDVDAAASRILLLHRGRLRFDGPPADLIARAQGRAFTALLEDTDLKDFSHHYRITARVRTLEGIRVRAVAPPDASAVAGEVVTPGLEEAYLAEIDRADLEAGLEPRRDRFGFLEE